MEYIEKYDDKIPLAKDSWQVHDKLFRTLNTLKEFFYGDGEGVPKEQLETEQFNVCWFLHV